MRSPDLVTAEDDVPAATPAFRVRVGDFDGPFDLLLTLIGRRELDITEVALSVVTDEFLGFLGDLVDTADLERASAFLVVGATLLDLKLASLLPQGELVDAEDVALLEARDLLFARLLQYRAYKRAAEWLAEALAAEALRPPIASRAAEAGPLPPRPLELRLDPAEFAALALQALHQKAVPTVGLEHLHSARVSLREQAAAVAARLRGGAAVAFSELAGSDTPVAVVVARFLAVLELYRHAAVAFEQVEPLGALLIRWTAENWDDEMLDALGRDWDE